MDSGSTESKSKLWDENEAAEMWGLSCFLCRQNVKRL